MFWIALIIAGALLALERATYALTWYYPAHFERFCQTPPLRRFASPVDALQGFFYLFKIIQLSVFIAWCVVFSGQWLPIPTAPASAIALGLLLLLVGQALNFGVFWRLGKNGVFYGNKLGHDVPWVEGLPFSLVPHPQYVGTTISIWGSFLIMRFPNPDWIALPLLQTVYYALGARLER